ncbi:MAG: hypothetical protein HYR76_03805 [Ignavibacteria bacterium]|nr:hypothetical protein [Ignavibacteria bacterium]
MILLTVVKPGNPNLFELFGVVFGILFAIFVLNAVYEFLKKKPWKKKDIPELTLPENHSNNLII